MKNVFLSFAVLISFLAVSCKKENNAKPLAARPAPAVIDVEYKITSESANVVTNYMYPNADGKLEMKSETINRSDYAVTFKSTKGNFLSVEAYNVNAARKAVHVQIYVNGTLFQEASSSSPSQKAIASGNY